MNALTNTGSGMWEEVRFRYLADVHKGSLPSSVDQEGLNADVAPYLTMEYLRGEVCEPMLVGLSPNVLTASENDTLLLWDGSNAGEFLRAKRGIVSSTTALVTSKSVDPGFLYWACKAQENKIKAETVGMGIPHVNGEFLSNLHIQIPDANRQRGIANFLDRETARLEALIAEKETVLELLAEKRRALITLGVTRGLDPNVPLSDSGIPWLRKIPAHWDLTRLRFLATSIEQGWSPEALAHQPDLHEWGVLRLNAVNRGRFDENATKTLPPDVAPRTNLEVRSGDVLITRSNTPLRVGDACFVEATRPRLMLSDLIYRLNLRTESIDGRFLVYFLTLHVGRVQIESDARGTSASMVKISQEHIKDWWLPLPPLTEQRSIIKTLAVQIREIDHTRAVTESTIALISERRSALITAAVTGQVDLASMP